MEGRAVPGVPEKGLLRALEWLVLGGVILWLGVAAWLVDIERYDGYQAFINARWVLGAADVFQFNRAPLMGVVLAPAELLKMILGLDPLEPRPDHAINAALLVVYALGVYRLLVRHFGRSAAVLLAYTGSIPTFLFFSVSPFVDCDVFPGLIFLAMLLELTRFLETPTRRGWIALVLWGAIGALIKNTYAIFWFSVLTVAAISVVEERSRSVLSKFGFLVLGSACSMLLFWIASIPTLGADFGEAPLLLRPYYMLHFMVTYGGGGAEFPTWVYLRNAAAFGPLVVLLIVPALIRAFRAGSPHRAVAIGWLFGCLILSFINYREVRYLAFLAPLSAFLLVPVCEWLLARRWGAASAVGVVVLSFFPQVPYSPSVAIARVGTPFFRHSELRHFVEPLRTEQGLMKPLLGKCQMLSFSPPEPTPLAGDRYDQLYHFGAHQFWLLIGYEPQDIRSIDRGIPSPWQDRAALIWCEGPVLINPPSWQVTPPSGKDQLVQELALADSLALDLDEDGRLTRPGSDQELGRVEIVEGELLLRGAEVEALIQKSRLPFVELPGRGRIMIEPGPGGLRLRGLQGSLPVGRWVMRMFRIVRQWP